jgi:ABC-type glycerol-3-phosphate transport system permease component
VLSFVLAALAIPGSLLLAPGYKLLHDIGLLNTYAGLILPAIAPAFGVFLFRQSIINSVPDSLIENARIDGAGEFQIFFVIILPIVRPMIGAYLMITFLGTWNNFINPQIVLQDPDRFPLSVAINQLRGIYSTDWGMIMSGTLISIAPVMLLFLLLQKEFISGLTSGAVKG